MQPLSAVRKLHYDQMRYAQKTVEYILQTTPRADISTYRDGSEGWRVSEVLGHLLDCDRLYLERAKLTTSQDQPFLPFPDQTEDVARGDYNQKDVRKTFALWQAARTELLEYWAAIPDDCWEREGHHPVYPVPFSLNDQVFLACWHDQVHIEQITRILTQKTK